MNKTRRVELNRIQIELQELKYDVEILRDEEQEYLGNMPESLNGSDYANTAKEAIGIMDSVIDNLQEACESLMEVE